MRKAETEVPPDSFDSILHASETSNVATGYFLRNRLLVRKWVPVSEDGVKNYVFQIEVPTKFRSLILRVSHDECGHFGVWKTYHNILKHFFWPWVKRDISAYIKTCYIWQLTGKPNQKVEPATLQPILL